MTPVAFLPGFDGEAALRREFTEALAADGEVRAVSYPPRPLGTLAAYCDHAMGEIPVDWRPVLVAESFGGLVAARWASVDPRVRAVVLCGAFASNPVGQAAALGASLPLLVKLGPMLSAPMAWASGDSRRRAWSEGFNRALGGLPEAVVAERMRLIATEDATPALAQLRVPLVVVHFASDLVIGPLARGRLEAACHNARVLTLPGPHFALETRPLECARAIRGELRRLFPEPAPA